MNLRWSGTKAAEGLATRHSGGLCIAILSSCTLKVMLCWAPSSLQGPGVLGDGGGRIAALVVLSVKGHFMVSLGQLTSHPNLRGDDTGGLPNTPGVSRERCRCICLICVCPVAVIKEIVPDIC